MHLRWSNGVLDIGRLWYLDAYGIELAWGRRDLMGENVSEGETIFADRRVLVLVTGLDVHIHGSIWRAILARWFQPVR